MSDARPNCSVCLHQSIFDIDRLLKQGTSPARVKSWLTARRIRAAAKRPAIADTLSPTPSFDSLRRHQAVCLEVAPAGHPSAQSSQAIYIEPGTPLPKLVSPEELADPKRRLDLIREALASRIGDLSADKLYTMYMAELKLQTAQAERDAKSVPSSPEALESDGLDQAMAQAAGHLPDLRLVGGRHAKIARR